jgi:hypothetical protein
MTGVGQAARTGDTNHDRMPMAPTAPASVGSALALIIAFRQPRDLIARAPQRQRPNRVRSRLSDRRITVGAQWMAVHDLARRISARVTTHAFCDGAHALDERPKHRGARLTHREVTQLPIGLGMTEQAARRDRALARNPTHARALRRRGMTVIELTRRLTSRKP